MNKISLSILKLLLLAVVSATSWANGINGSEDDCDGELNPNSEAASDLRRALALVGMKPGQGLAPTEALESVNVTEYDLGEYISRLGLGEQFTDSIPVRGSQVLGFGDMPVTKVKKSMGSYPFENFSISPTGKSAAFKFASTYFPGDTYKTRDSHIFIARLLPETLKVMPVAELALPDRAQAKEVSFFGGEQNLCVEGIWNDHAGKLRSDIYFYTLKGSHPALISRLSENLGNDIYRVNRLDSPDRQYLYFFVEYRSQQHSENRHLFLRIHRGTGEAKNLGTFKLPRNVVAAVESMEFDDDRRGYLRENGDQLLLRSAYGEVIIDPHAGFEYRELDGDYIDNSRSAGSAWLFIDQDRKSRKIRLRNEYLESKSSFDMPNVVEMGMATQLNGVMIFSERNHPNYANYALWPSGKVELLTPQRLVQSDFHANIFAGVSQAKGEAAKIKVFIFE